MHGIRSTHSYGPAKPNRPKVALQGYSPHQVRVLAPSLKRDISPAAANHHADSPMSMTSPRTKLKREQNAPLSDQSSAAPPPTLPQRSHLMFLRRDLRQGADYHAQTPLDKAGPMQAELPLLCWHHEGRRGAADAPRRRLVPCRDSRQSPSVQAPQQTRARYGTGQTK